MILNIGTTYQPATDLGYLLHKNPGKLHSKELPFGTAHLFFPVATEENCYASIFVDVDPIALVRGRPDSSGGGRFDQYVNDRPYAASSFLSTALKHLLNTAMSGRSKERPELADAALPLWFEIPVLPCRGGEKFLRSLFEPLGFAVACEAIPLDDQDENWGKSLYLRVRLETTSPLKDALNQIYVLIPVLDDDKHYYVGADEIDKLFAKGEGWLQAHPQREEIAKRYLKRQRHLTQRPLPAWKR